MNLAKTIVETVHGYRFSVSNEQELQEGLWRVLAGMDGARREVRLDERSRIDFLIGGVGIEVKVDGSLADLVRQATRYSKFAEVSEIVVVTTRSRHLGLPAQLGGKPVHIAYLGDGAL